MKFTKDGQKAYRVQAIGVEGLILNIIVSQLRSNIHIDGVLKALELLDNTEETTRTIKKTIFLNYLSKEFKNNNAMVRIMNNLKLNNNDEFIIYRNSYLFELALMYGIEQLAYLSEGEEQIRDNDDMPFWYNKNGIRIIDSGLNRMIIINKDMTGVIDSIDISNKVNFVDTKIVIEMLIYWKEFLKNSIV